MVELSYGLGPRRPVIAGLAVSLAAVVLAPPHAAADAPPCRYTVATGTVLDNDTGLTWQRAVNGATFTWSNAAAFCDNLVLDGNGWRLPSVQELQTLVDLDRFNPAVDTVAFPNTPSSSFWSSSVYAGGSDSAWYVYFVEGGAGALGQGNTYHVRCVR